MDFLSNLFHSIGNVIGIGGNNNAPQNNNQPVGLPKSNLLSAPQNNRPIIPLQPEQTNAAPQQPQNQVNLNQPLVKASPNTAPTPTPIQAPIQAPAPPQFDPNSILTQPLNKAPISSPTPAIPLGPPDKRSFGQQLLDGAKGVGGVLAGTALGVLRAGEGVVQGIPTLADMATHALNYIPRKIAGDNSTVGKFFNQANRDADTTTSDINKPVNWLASETDKAASAYGQSSEDVYKPAQVGANIATLIPAAETLLTKVPGVADKLGGVGDFIDAQKQAPTLSKAVSPVTDAINSHIAKLDALNAGGKTPDEIAVGIKSANPTQAADASQVADQQAAQIAANQPPVEPVTSDAMHSTETETLNNLNDAAKSRVLTPQEKEVQATLQSKLDGIQTANAPVETGPNGTPQPSQEAQPAAQPQTPVQPAAAVQPAEAKPLENSSSPNNVAQGEPTVNPQAVTAPNAPNVRAVLSKGVDDLINKVGPNASSHEVISNPELTAAAQKWADASTPQELVSEYANQPKLNGASDMARANVSLHKLVQEAQTQGVTANDAANPINKAIDNIVNGLAEHSSAAGRSQNYLQEIYGNLPMEAKIPIIVRNIDRARELSGLPLIKENLPLQSEIQAKLNNLLSTGETIAKARNDAADAAEAARTNLLEQQKADPNFQLSKEDASQLVKQGQAAQSTIKQANNALEKNQGDLAKYVSEVSGKPQNTLGSIQGIKNVGLGKAILNTVTNAGKGLAELQKSLMLASISGPLNDSTLSGMNAARELTNMTTNALIGKGLNAVRSLTGQAPGKYVSQLPSVRTLIRGSNLAKTGGEMKGNLYTPDALSTLTKTTGEGRTGLLQKADNGMLTKFNARIHATREAATNLTAGMQDVKVQQLANQEAKQAGLTGDAAKAYTALRTATPTDAMTAQGVKLREEVNNMNDNPISRGLGSKGGGVLGGISKVPGVGPLIQNLFQPFSQWVGSQGWNAITDQNIAANVAKAAAAATKHDAQGVVDNISKLTVNAGGGITAGYALAHSGLLTTNHGTSSSANDGLYLHVGNQYIPVTFFGGAAPSLIMGYSAYTGMHSNPQGSMTSHIMNIAQNTLDISGKAYAGGTPIGGTNSLFGPYGVATQAGQVLHPTAGTHTTWGDVGSNVGTQEASMMIPGVASNVNALINQFGGDPTHTAPQTNIKTLNPKTGNMVADPIASNNAYLESRIPILSQGMPRNLTKAAPTFASQYTRGSNATQTQVDTAAATAKQTASDAAQALSDYKAGIPVYTKTGEVSAKSVALPKGYNFDNTLNTAIQTGNYDNAIKGLQGELKAMNTPGPDHIPPSTKEAIQDHIGQLKVFKALGTTASLMDTYSSTTKAQWRDMGNPDSNGYDPKMYQDLFTLDQALANAGVSGGSITTAGKGNSPKFSVSTSSSSSASKAAALVKSNTVGTPIQQQRESFINNLLQPAQTLNLPEAKLTKPGALIAPRKISVGMPKA